MKMFLHNRVGKYLLKDEVANIRSITRRDFKKGEMIVYERGPLEYTWAIFNKDNGDGTAEIIASPPGEDDPRLMNPIQKTNLHEYSPSEVIKQNYKAGDVKLGEEDLLETYIINQ